MVCYSGGTVNSLLRKLTSMNNHSNLAKELKELVWEVKELKRDFLDKIASLQGRHIQVKLWMKQVRDLVFDIEDWIDLKPDTNMVDPSDIEDIEYFKTEIKEARERFTWYDLLAQEPNQLDLAVEESTTIDPLLAEEKTCHGPFNDSRHTIEKHLMDKQMRLKIVSVVGMEGLGKTTLAREIFAMLQPQGHFDCQAFVAVGRRPSMREILNDIFRQVIPPGSHVSEDGKIQQNIKLREYLSGKRYFIILDGIWSTRAWKVISCSLPANNRGSRVLTTTCLSDIGKFCTGHPNDVVYQMAALTEENSRILFLSRISPQEKEKLPYFEEYLGPMLDICGGMPLAITVTAGLFSRKSKEMSESKMLGKSEEMAESKMLVKSEEIAEWKMLGKSEKMAELRMLGKSVIPSLKQCSTTEGLKIILEITYADLSLPVRSCFLYLSIFPENYTIKKDRLIQLWGAEGFIPLFDKECSWVAGERYFNELISRGLTQPVFDYDDDHAMGCTVHSVILDFIRALSRDENFATRDAELSSGPFPCDTIRRFSLVRSNEDEFGTLSRNMVHLSSVRSLMVFGDAEGMFDPPLALDYKDDEETHLSSVLEDSKNEAAEGIFVRMTLLSFKLIRVLDLEDTKNLNNHHLEGIGGLVLLRYLGLRGTGISILPGEIRQLEQLETLDLRQNGLIQSIDRFPKKLVRLLGDKILYGQGIRKFLYDQGMHIILYGQAMHKNLEMTELEEVSTVRAWGRNSVNKVVDLVSKSKRLRMLGVELDISGNNPTLSFFEEVVKSKIHSLSLTCSSYDDDRVRLLLDSWKKATASSAVTFEPRRIELIFNDYYLGALPPNTSSLLTVTHLRIKILRVESEELGILGGLPNLVHLDLTTSSYTSGSGRLTIEKGAFPCLKVLLFNCGHIVNKGLQFNEGSVPQLRRLRTEFRALKFLAVDEFQVLGIQHLTCLMGIRAIIDCYRATIYEVENAVAQVRGQVSQNPNKPTLELSLTRQERMTTDQGTQSTDYGVKVYMHAPTRPQPPQRKISRPSPSSFVLPLRA